jgi:hypothetical protein
MTTSLRPSPVTSPIATAFGHEPTDVAWAGPKRDGWSGPSAVTETSLERGPSPTELTALTS